MAKKFEKLPTPHPIAAPQTAADEELVSLGELTATSRKKLLVVGVLLSLGAVWAYWPTFLDLISIWSNEPDYSHGFFVIPLAALFLWLRRDRMPLDASMAPSLVPGCILLGLAILFRLAGVLLYIAPLDAMTIPLWVAGSVWLLLGRRWMLWALPVVAFLFFMAPLPYKIESMLSFPLQSLATTISAWMLVVAGQPAVAIGNVIWIDDNLLNVEEACSGLRMFMGVTALATAYAIVMRRSWGEKAIVFFSVLPIAVIANSLRIAATGLCYQAFDQTESTRAFVHDAAGFFVIIVAAAMMGGVVWFLKKAIIEVESTNVGAILHGAKDLRRVAR